MNLPVRFAPLAVLAALVLPGFAVSAATDPAPDATDQPAADQAAGTDQSAGTEWYGVHAQITNVTQYHPPFSSPFRGANSLDPGHRGDETVSATLFAGIRLADHLEFYADPEVDQGLGLSNTLGIADFPNGEAFKLGSVTPIVRLQSAFARYTIGLGGEVVNDEPDQNQLGGSHLADNVIITLGKFGVTSIFDTNDYAHDMRADFLNFTIIDGGAFDYAADAFGYTYGTAVEWTQSSWTLRTGIFDLSRIPNSKALVRGFGQFSTIAEFELRQDWVGPGGKIKFLAFENSGDLANYNDAVRAAAGTGLPPNVADVRKFSTKPGAEINIEQPILPDLGAFLRASLDDGHKEAEEFTDVNSSVSTGLSLSGGRWGRPDDRVGLAGVVSGISKDAQRYFAAGGLGILIGDGQLPKYDPEGALELFYSAHVIDGVTFTVDYQHIENPGYDPLRGPVDVFGFRVHGQF